MQFSELASRHRWRQSNAIASGTAMMSLRPSLLAHSEIWEWRNGNIAEMPFSREGRLSLSLCVLRESQPAAHARRWDEI
jgi:hypothetical protein